MGRALTPMTSRTTPPTPVLAPPNGSRAEGWLWVSTLKARSSSVVKRDDAGVVDEGGAHPGAVNLVGGGADIGVEQTVDAGRDAVRSRVVDFRLERFVNAVFAPGLGHHFQLGVGRFPFLFAEIALDGLHLGQRERQPPRLADGQQGLVVRGRQGNGGHCLVGRLVAEERRGDGRVDGDALDDGIGQDALGDGAQGLSVERALQLIALAGCGPFDPVNAQQPGGADEVVGRGVGDAGQQGDIDKGVGGCVRFREAPPRPARTFRCG